MDPADTGLIPGFERAELEALQLERLRESLARAYAQVPHYTRAFDEAGVRPDDRGVARRPRALPVHDQGRPA